MKKGLFIPFNLLLIFLGLLSACVAQKVSENLEQRLLIPVKAVMMKVDPLGQIYVLTDKNELQKYDASGNIKYRYSSNVLGELTSLDVTNPMKLILFYADYQVVISLDNTLAETGRYDLQAFGFGEVPVVALSNDNQLWLYDAEQFSLKKINDQGELILESYSLVSENLGSLQPRSLRERMNRVYMNVPDKGILEFDNFGQFMRVIPVLGAKDFQLESGGLVFFDGKALFRYDNFLFEASRLSNWDPWLKGASSVHLKKEKLYILNSDGVWLNQAEK